MQTSYQKWLVLISAGLMILLVNLDGSIVSIALAQISKSLDADLTSIQWVVGIYLLTTAVFFAIFGRLADIYGEKRIFLLGSGIFTLASLLCGVSQTENMLIAARFLQGLGFAATLGISLVIITNAFPDEQKGLASGVAITLTGLGQVLGPTLGGIILSFASWHWIFLINVPIGIVAMILTFVFVPKDIPKDGKKGLHYRNVFLYVLGVSIIMVTLNELAELSLLTITMLLLLGTVITLFFILHSRKIESPLISLDLLTNKQYILIASSRFIFMYIWLALLVFVPLFLQNLLNYSPMKAGFSMMAMTVMLAILSPLTGKYCDRRGFKKPVVASMICAAISYIGLAFVHQGVNFWILIVTLMVFGVACGFHIPSTINGVVSSSPAQHKGAGMGLFFTVAFFGSTVGVAICGSFIGLRSTSILTQAIADQSLTVTPALLENLKLVASGTHSALWLQAESSAANMVELSQIAQQAFVTSFNEMAWINAALLLIGLLIASRLKKVAK